MSGDILRKKREERGLEISEIAGQLRIRADYLSSIEQDLFDKLPAPVYTMGYIRSYARHLEVDPTAILEVYAQRLPKPKTDNSAIPVVLAEKKRPLLLYLVLAVAAAAIGTGVYLRISHGPVQKQIEKTETRADTKPHKIEKQPAPSRGKPESDLKAKTEIPPPLPDNQKAAAAPYQPATIVPDGQSQELPASDQNMHLLSIHAVETSWVYVKFRNGKYESVTLRPGSSKQWNFSESAFIKIGNAGGIKLMLDGQEVGTPGQSGQVITLTLPLPAQ
ncbi:MAG: RodZ domain-containing protein [Thermodesulfovibrionales bacterium]